VLKKVTRDDAHVIADLVMEALLLMLRNSAATAAWGVQEDALLAVSALIEGEHSFIRLLWRFCWNLSL